MLRRLGSVQLDTISVLARSHELVPYARLGALPRAKVEKAYWKPTAPATCFEYWSHAACILPAEEWPLFAFRRRWFRARGQRWHQVSQEACDRVLETIRAGGAMTVSDLGGGRNGGEWWDWSDTKIAVEWLLDIGELVCAERRAWKRVYDLPERALAPELVAPDLDDDACLTQLVEQAGAAMGVATEADLARLPPPQARPGRRGDRRHRAGAHRGRRLGQAGLGAPRGARAAGHAGPSPHDPAVALSTRSPWHRPRTLRIFDFKHSLEAYVPAPKRVHGLFRDAAAGRRTAPRAASTPGSEGTDARRQAPLVRAERGGRHGRRAEGGRQLGDPRAPRRGQPARAAGPAGGGAGMSVVDHGMRAYYEAPRRRVRRLVLNGTGVFAAPAAARLERARSRPDRRAARGSRPRACSRRRLRHGFLARHLPGPLTAHRPEPGMVAIAAARMPGADVRQGEAVPLPFADRAFERLATGALLRHLRARERAAFLAEARRVARELDRDRHGAAPGDHEPGEKQERVLDDGTRHSVYKRFFTPEGLADELGGGEAVFAGTYFVAVRCRFGPVAVRVEGESRHRPARHRRRTRRCPSTCSTSIQPDGPPPSPRSLAPIMARRSPRSTRRCSAAGAWVFAARPARARHRDRAARQRRRRR